MLHDRSRPIPTSTTLTRRTVLRSGTAAALSAIGASCAGPRAPSPTVTMTIPGAGELIPENMPQAFTVQEIERRWTAVRDRMRTEDFDGLMVPMRPIGNADVKYLTESEANWVIIPLEGKVTAIFAANREAEVARSRHQLDMDIRVSGTAYSAALADRLRELSLTRGRIGVGNLAGTLRDLEGGVSYTTLQPIMEEFPAATFASASDLLMRVKLVRSPEEIAVLRMVSRAGELAIRAIVETARPGVLHRQVWFEVFRVLLQATGEIPPRIAIAAGSEAGTSGGIPLNERLPSGAIVNQAISGSVLGYLSQVNHSVCVGNAPSDWADAFQYCVDLFHALVDWIKPGRSFQEFADFYRAGVEERGDGYWGVVFHTAGAAEDGPRMGPTRPQEHQDLVLQPGMVFTIKPRVPITGVDSPAAQVGDPVLVTETGAERLGRRSFDLYTLV